MAIFSQKDAKTSVDFRNYNKESPNRVVPFQIDKGYSKKLSLLARQLNLFSGSFDILVDACNNYYFLEVNPVGQFGMVSYPCNYFIEKNIALFIINQLNGHQ
jgi:glutathione synthase/RimK-type ligase-like ATP-grasp enzyme